MKKTFYSTIILSTALVFLTGCGKTPTLKNGEEAIATINGNEIAVNSLYENLKEKYGVNTLIDLIDKTLLDEKYKETEEEKSYIKQQIQYVKNYAEENKTTFSYIINYYYGVNDEESFKEILSLEYKRDLAVKEYIKENITDKEISKYYNESIKGDIEVKHILIKTNIDEDSMTDKEIKDAKEEAYKKANEVITKLNKGEKWKDLVKEYTEDENTKDKEGQLGWINIGDTEENFEKAAYSLKKDNYTKKPIETSYGYHIIYKISEKEKPDLKNVKSDIVETLATQKISNDENAKTNALIAIRKKAGLEIHDTSINKNYETYTKSF